MCIRDSFGKNFEKVRLSSGRLFAVGPEEVGGAVGEKDAVEMVDFVAHGARQIAVGVIGLLLPVAVERTHRDVEGAAHRPVEVADRKAALDVVLGAALLDNCLLYTSSSTSKEQHKPKQLCQRRNKGGHIGHGSGRQNLAGAGKLLSGQKA